jgi:sulfatase modifying factor 1
VISRSKLGPLLLVVVWVASCGGRTALVGGSSEQEPQAGHTSGGATATDGGAPVAGGMCSIASGCTPCNNATSFCSERPASCEGLAATCGSNGDQDCCTSNLVPGGTFYRGYDGVTYTEMFYPARVSDFRLDTYEITVGRFRKFVAAYSQGMIAQGAGANPNNPSDSGWDTSWNTSLDDSASSLKAALRCSTRGQTWVDAAGSAAAESLPITCLDWYEAEAFCIWDGGRLPTEAEWNYAASGGTLQREYPWGSATPDCTYANYYGAAGATDYCVSPGTGAANRVGSESPKGDSLYGQADLAGNAWEWVEDWNAGPYEVPCNDCANLAVSSARVIRGGGFYSVASNLLNSDWLDNIPSVHAYYTGARCARRAL